MPNYMLLVKDDLEGYSKVSSADMEQLIEKMIAWSSQLKAEGVHRGGEKLTDNFGKTVRKKNGELFLDGPYSEAKELIAGYFMVEAPNEEEAHKIASGCPALDYHSVLEVREVADVCAEVARLRVQ